MSLSSGTRLGPYEIVERIGTGGMGEVFRARDTRLDRSVAIKILSANVDARRMEQEARAISGLNHPNICTLYDIGHRDDGGEFLVMEYLDGETLASRLKKKNLTLDEAMLFAGEILDALDHAHRRGIIHRDLKPGNVMLVKSGARDCSKLLDFGLARLPPSRDTTKTQLTEAGALAGTLRYMAPEQLEGRPADARSDIYAFGLVLEEMTEGTRTHPLNEVMQRCLVRDAEERWQSARDLRVALHLARQPMPAAQPASVKRSFGLLWVTLAIAIMVLAAFFWSRRGTSREAVTFSFGAPEQAMLIPWPGVPSPDGRRIAFVAQERTAKTTLWIRSIASPAAERVPGTEGASGPFWSPDGKSIGFFAEGKLKRIAASGGPPVNICNAAVDLGASWNASDDIVFSPSNRTTLFRVSATGGTPQAITTLSADRHENSHRWPHFLPDGRHFLFTARSSDKENTTVYAGSLDSKETKRLMAAQSNAEYAAPGYLLFGREGTLMAQRFDAGKLQLGGEVFPVAGRIEQATPSASTLFSVSADGSVLSYQQAIGTSSVLSWFDRTGRALGNVGAAGEFTNPNLSPDGKRVALVMPDKETGNRDIWLMDVATGVMTRFTFNPANDWYPTWSPDGAFLAFASDRNAKSSIYRKAVGGSGEEELLLPPGGRGGSFPTDWSRDGRMILYQADAGGSLEIWLLPLTVESKPIPLLAGEFRQHDGRFSPDGRWVAYESNESGAPEIYVKPVAKGGAKVRISSNGGNYVKWRRDGKEMFYAAPDGMMMAAAVKAGDTFEAEPPKALFRACSADQPLRGSEPFYDVGRDGNRFLMACLAAETKQRAITVSINWLAGGRAQ